MMWGVRTPDARTCDLVHCAVQGSQQPVVQVAGTPDDVEQQLGFHNL